MQSKAAFERGCMYLLYRDGAFCCPIYHCRPCTFCYRNNELKFLGHTMLFQASMVFAEPGVPFLPPFFLPLTLWVFFQIQGQLSPFAGSHSCLSFLPHSLSYLLLYEACTLQRVEFCALTLICFHGSPIRSHERLKDRDFVSHPSPYLHSLTQWLMHIGFQ